jgi:K+/H+ antiporter YhaU regulatory subunit KhtT
VVDNKGIVTGLISMQDIKDHLFDRETLSDLLIANDIANQNFECVTIDENCQLALDKISKYNLEGLPVVEAFNSKNVIGMIWRRDIQDAYQKEIERREITSNLASNINMRDDEKTVQFLEGYSISEVKPPESFINKSIRELSIRASYGVDVLSIKTASSAGETIKAIPSPEYIIRKEDTLVIAGEIRNINLIKSID